MSASAFPSRPPRSARRGTTLFELIVAFGILGTLVGVSAGLLVRSGRLLVSARSQRIAIEELANTVERLRGLPAADRDTFLASPRPSAFAVAHLPGASLAAHVGEPDAAGMARVEVALEWNEPGRRGNPLRLAAWLPVGGRAGGAGEVTP